MISKNIAVITLFILFTPFLSGCSLVDQNQSSNLDAYKQKEEVTEIVSNTEESTNEIVSGDELNIETIENTTTTEKTNNNLIKNNSMDKFDASKQYVAVLSTSLGDITINFNKNQTPKTVENFVTLAQKGFYDSTIFHRIIKGFMIQGGDPVGNGTGDPGYKFADEPFNDEYVRGAVAMANSGPNTNGSQFFILHADYPLPKNYTIFGHVVNGMETVDKIAESKVEEGGFGERSTPVVPTVIKSIEIITK
ncbi:MAG: peptidylprolyl isomerase [Candidatus Magasanikbacteria bacterium]